MRVWNKPQLFIQVLGDIGDPRLPALEQRVRLYAGYLLDQIGLSRQKFRFQTFREDDGTLITVHCHRGALGELVQARIILQPTTAVVETPLLILESGQLVWTGVPDEVPKVYTGDVLNTYFAGVGVTLSAPLFGSWLQGLAQISANPAPPPQAFLAFPVDPPAVDAGGYYLSEAWKGNASVPDTELKHPTPSLFTGLLRAAVQAKIGAKRSVQELVPSAWQPLDGRYNGLLTDPDGGFWICRTTATSSQACRLTGSGTFAELAAQSATMVDEDKRLADAWLLADLSVATPTEIVTLWEVDPALSGFSLGHGWHYARDGSEACIVLIEHHTPEGDYDYFDSRIHTLSFSWTLELGEYVPSATLTSGTTSDPWRINHLHEQLWYPVSGADQYQLLYTNAPYSALESFVDFRGNEGPVYCYYDAAGTAKVVMYEQYYAVVGTGSLAYQEPCPARSWGAAFTGTYTTYEGGFRTQDKTPVNQQVQIGTLTERFLALENPYISGPGTWSANNKRFPLFKASACDEAALQAEAEAVWDGNNFFYLQERRTHELTRNATAQKVTSVISDAKNRHSLIIPYHDAEAIIYLENDARTKTSKRTEEWADCQIISSTEICTLWNKFEWRKADQTYLGSVECDVRIEFNDYYDRFKSGGYFTTWTAWTNPSFVNYTYSDNTEYNVNEEETTVCVSASNWSYCDTHDGNDWTSFFTGTPNSATRSLLGDVISAYNEGGLLLPQLGSIVSENGWKLQGPNTRFIGGA